MWGTHSIDSFTKLSNMFVEKWKAIDKPVAQHIEKEWLIKNKNWFAASSVKSPTTNNCLEAFNGTFKSTYTSRERQPLGTFLKTIEKCIVAKSVEAKPFVTTPTVTR